MDSASASGCVVGYTEVMRSTSGLPVIRPTESPTLSASLPLTLLNVLNSLTQLIFRPIPPTIDNGSTFHSGQARNAVWITPSSSFRLAPLAA